MRILMLRLQRKPANFLIEKQPNTQWHAPKTDPNQTNPILKIVIAIQHSLTHEMRHSIVPKIDPRDQQGRPDEIGQQVYLISVDIIVILFGHQVVPFCALQDPTDEPPAK